MTMRSPASLAFFFFNDTATTEIYTLSLHDALPILPFGGLHPRGGLQQLPPPSGRRSAGPRSVLLVLEPPEPAADRIRGPLRRAAPVQHRDDAAREHWELPPERERLRLAPARQKRRVVRRVGRRHHGVRLEQPDESIPHALRDLVG